MLSALAKGSLLLLLGQLPWQLGLRSEGRLFRAAGDLQLDPRLTFGYESRDGVVHLNYGPTLLVKAPAERGTFDAAHAGSLAGSLRLGRDTRISATQTFSAGEISLSWLALPPEAPPPTIVRDARSSGVTMLNESTSAAVDHAINRHLHVSGTAGYAITGGQGEGLTAIPQTRTASARATGGWVARNDDLSLSVGGSRGWVSTADTTWQLDAYSSWRHAFTPASERALHGEPTLRMGERSDPRYETELSAGLSLVRGGAAEGERLVPTAALALRRDEPAPRFGALGARVLVRYAPSLDVATGGLVPRYEGSGRIDLRLHRRVVAFAAGGLGLTPDAVAPVPQLLAQGGAGFSYEPFEGVAISAAARVVKLAQVEWGGVVTTSVTRTGRF